MARKGREAAHVHSTAVARAAERLRAAKRRHADVSEQLQVARVMAIHFDKSRANKREELQQLDKEIMELEEEYGRLQHKADETGGKAADRPVRGGSRKRSPSPASARREETPAGEAAQDDAMPVDDELQGGSPSHDSGNLTFGSNSNGGGDVADYEVGSEDSGGSRGRSRSRADSGAGRRDISVSSSSGHGRSRSGDDGHDGGHGASTGPQGDEQRFASNGREPESREEGERKRSRSPDEPREAKRVRSARVVAQVQHHRDMTVTPAVRQLFERALERWETNGARMTNISVLNDIMRAMDSTWHVGSTRGTFAMLCQRFEEEGLCKLKISGSSTLLAGSKRVDAQPPDQEKVERNRRSRGGRRSLRGKDMERMALLRDREAFERERAEHERRVAALADRDRMLAAQAAAEAAARREREAPRLRSSVTVVPDRPREAPPVAATFREREMAREVARERERERERERMMAMRREASPPRGYMNPAEGRMGLPPPPGRFENLPLAPGGRYEGLPPPPRGGMRDLLGPQYRDMPRDMLPERLREGPLLRSMEAGMAPGDRYDRRLSPGGREGMPLRDMPPLRRDLAPHDVRHMDRGGPMPMEHEMQRGGVIERGGPGYDRPVLERRGSAADNWGNGFGSGGAGFARGGPDPRNVRRRSAEGERWGDAGGSGGKVGVSLNERWRP